jgi:YidC/Oxa1 family membrane protein insertase
MPAAVPTPSLSRAGQDDRARDAALAGSPRIAIETARLHGSISLKGARIDDLALTTIGGERGSAEIVLSPSGAPGGFYFESGWTAVNAKAPGIDALWRQLDSGPLTVDHPVTLVNDSGGGLQFRRTFAVDDQYMFTITDEVTNNGSASSTLRPVGWIWRDIAVRGGPNPPRFIGLLGAAGVHQISFEDVSHNGEPEPDGFKTVPFGANGGWLGVVDGGSAVIALPARSERVDEGFHVRDASEARASYGLGTRRVGPGATANVAVQFFVGPKKSKAVTTYQAMLGLNQFDRLLDAK